MKAEQDAANLAQLLKMALEEMSSPSFADRMRLIAGERRAKYLAHIEAGFTEAQALDLCRN